METEIKQPFRRMGPLPLMATVFAALRVVELLNPGIMQYDLVTLSKQFPGLMVSVSLEDLLSAGRTLSAEIIESIAQTRDEATFDAGEKEQLLTREETGRKLGVSYATLWRWSRDGYLTPVKVGSQTRYRAADISALISKKGGAK